MTKCDALLSLHNRRLSGLNFCYKLFIIRLNKLAGFYRYSAGLVLSSRHFVTVGLRKILVVLSAHELSVVKSDRLLFDKVNFSVEPAGLVYVKGPNGAGKTSLLRVLSGLVEPEQGEVRFADQKLAKVREQFHHSLVYFGHKLGLNLRLSAIENLHFWCQQQQQACDIEQLYAVLGQLQLVGLEDVPVGQLSAGQQRRVALSRLWLKSSARLWILDEPFTALDQQGIQLLSAKLGAFLAAQGSVIMTSHQELEFDYPRQELALEYRI